MAEAPVVAHKRAGRYRTGSGVVHPGPPAGFVLGAAPARMRWGSALAVSEARRAWNRDRIGLVSDLRCECTRLSCRDKVPAVAETHRRVADQLVVVPAHFDGGVVVRAADRFFVVESGGRAIRHSQGEMT